MTQCKKILRHLQTYGTITPMEALQEYSCFRLGARVHDLKRLGYPVKTEMVTDKNRFGEATHYARYRLEETENAGN